MLCKIYGLLLTCSMDRFNLFVLPSSKLAPGNGTSYCFREEIRRYIFKMMALYPCSSYFLAGVLSSSPLAVALQRMDPEIPMDFAGQKPTESITLFCFFLAIFAQKKGWLVDSWSLMLHPANLSYITHRIHIWYIQVLLTVPKNQQKKSNVEKWYTIHGSYG